MNYEFKQVLILQSPLFIQHSMFDIHYLRPWSKHYGLRTQNSALLTPCTNLQRSFLPINIMYIFSIHIAQRSFPALWPVCLLVCRLVCRSFRVGGSVLRLFCRSFSEGSNIFLQSMYLAPVQMNIGTTFPEFTPNNVILSKSVLSEADGS
jgi:hypothetical protein